MSGGSNTLGDSGRVYRLRRDALDWLPVDDEVVVLDQQRGLYLGTNPSGARLWKALGEGASRDQLVELLVDAFEIDRDRAADDVDEFLQTLSNQDLIERA
jgi:phosphatidylserine/phosphatidylglycerophosphate/cardiolipin synthase-like enzyme